MLIKHGDGKVLSVIKSSDLEDVDQDEVQDAAVKKLKQADAKNKNVKLAKKENKNV